MSAVPPAVSVVIPAYNAAEFLEKTLDTVRAQTYTDHEIIVVDDGSADATTSVAEGYLRNHGLRGRVLRQANRGIAGARNAGMRAAQGTFIALLDHDDFWLEEKLALVMSEFARHPETDLVGHHIRMTKDGREIAVMRKGPAGRNMYDQLLLTANMVSPSAAVFRREKGLGIGGFREERALSTVEDYDFWMRLSRTAKFRFIDRVLSEYPLRADSASARVELHHKNLEQLLRAHFQERFGERPGPWARLRMRRRLAAVYRSALGQLISSGAEPIQQRDYLARMLSEFPLDPKNIGRALQWAISGWR